jgi:RNA polymerase sigma-B factor
VAALGPAPRPSLRRAREPTDDLVQTATIGLIKAIDRYDPSFGVEFGGFAVPTVVGELKRHFRDHTWSIRVPRRLQELRLAITAANSTLTHTLGRSPGVPDIAEHLGITEEQVLEGLEGARAYNATSLSIPIGADGTIELADTLGDDHGFALTELRMALGPAMAVLNERERTILTLRFYGNLTQTEIAEQVGLSQMHVSRLITKALLTLREHLNHRPHQPAPPIDTARRLPCGQAGSRDDCRVNIWTRPRPADPPLPHPQRMGPSRSWSFPCLPA